jgi:DNA-binding FrmR family transcriptional regulator
MEQHILEHGQDGSSMEIEIEYKEYLISSRIKSLNGRINSIGTEEDSGESLEDLQAQIQALTNLLEML